MRAQSIADFAARTKIEVPVGANETALVPFSLWPAQARIAETMERERLLVILKARQLGISWLACLYALRLCTLWPGQPILCLSRGQLEANDLIHRISTMYHEHADRTSTLPRLVKDNTADLEWDNGSTVVSLAATKNAGRSLTASLAILDEWAFMAYPRETLAAVKPTIDAGGKLFLISSGDGLGTEYHRHWLAATSGSTGYTAIFIPWWERPDRGADWREQKLIESGGDTATIYREYPANDVEAFANASGLVYAVWSDGPLDGNVTEDAEYIPGGGSVYWACDDGYAGARDEATGMFTANSHPRVFLLIQEKADGHIDVFAESYAIKTEVDPHLGVVAALPSDMETIRSLMDAPLAFDAKPVDIVAAVAAKHPGLCYDSPEYIAIDSAAATLSGMLTTRGFYIRKKPSSVEESKKNLRAMIAPDANGFRRARVHPRCKHLRFELASYREDPATGKPVEAFDHGPSALRYFAWTKRLEQ
jgi:hypothetical protein